jgi:hypothetical protein
MMDLVYSQACLTIVAAEGDAYSGLPGVNGLSRSVQKHLTIGQMSMNEWLIPHVRILTSSWIKRAWTYQEGALSSRDVNNQANQAELASYSKLLTYPS